MIIIMRGADEDLQAYCADAAARSRDGISLLQPPGARVSWYGVRCIVAHLRRVRGAEVEGVLARHRAAASLVLEDIAQDTLSPEERSEREALQARLDSHLSHNGLLQAMLVTQWADILRELTADPGCSLFIPNLDRLDPQSLMALRALYRAHADHPASITIGYDPGASVPAPEPNGVVWRAPRSFLQGIAFSLQMIDGARVVDVPITPLAPNRASATEAVGTPLSSCTDIAAFRAVSATGAALSDADVAGVVHAIRYSFHNFGFSSVLLLGLGLLRCGAALNRAQAADVHAMIALSAHNLHMHSARDLRLARFLEGQLTAALAAETRLPERAALLYRLAVTTGRRQGRLAPAMDWANRMIDSVSTLQADPMTAVYVEAWALNIRSYLHVRSRENAAALSDCERALRILERAERELSGTPGPSRWTNELALSRIVVLENLIKLAVLMKDTGGRLRWQEQASALQQRFPRTGRLQMFDWMDLHRGSLRFDLALPVAERGIDAARAEGDVFWQYYFITQVAEMTYGLGRPSGAYELFAQAERLRAALGAPETLGSLELDHAAALLRAGAPDKAAVVLSNAGEACGSPIRRAHVLARLAIVHAAQGRGDAADGAMNVAIELAVESGVRDLLLDVAGAAGRACQLLGRTEEAGDAYRRVEEIARAAPGETASPPPLDVLAAAAVGSYECGDRGPEVVLRCLERLPGALERAEAWWLLPRVLAMVASECAAIFSTEVLTALVTAASQREDCTGALGELLDALPIAQSAALSRCRAGYDGGDPLPQGPARGWEGADLEFNAV